MSFMDRLMDLISCAWYIEFILCHLFIYVTIKQGGKITTFGKALPKFTNFAPLASK